MEGDQGKYLNIPGQEEESSMSEELQVRRFIERFGLAESTGAKPPGEEEQIAHPLSTRKFRRFIF